MRFHGTSVTASAQVGGKAGLNSFLSLLASSCEYVYEFALALMVFSPTSELFIFLCKLLQKLRWILWGISLCGFLFEFQRTPQPLISHLHLEGKARIIAFIEPKETERSSSSLQSPQQANDGVRQELESVLPNLYSIFRYWLVKKRNSGIKKGRAANDAELLFCPSLRGRCVYQSQERQGVRKRDRQHRWGRRDNFWIKRLNCHIHHGRALSGRRESSR